MCLCLVLLATPTQFTTCQSPSCLWRGSRRYSARWSAPCRPGWLAARTTSAYEFFRTSAPTPNWRRCSARCSPTSDHRIGEADLFIISEARVTSNHRYLQQIWFFFVVFIDKGEEPFMRDSGTWLVLIFL